MPRTDKTFKERKHNLLKIGKTEKDALKAMGHSPKFPKKLERTRNHNRGH